MAMTEEEKEAYETYKAWSESFPLCEMCGERMDPDLEHVCPVVERQNGEVRYEDFYDYAHEEREHEAEGVGGIGNSGTGQQQVRSSGPNGEPY